MRTDVVAQTMQVCLGGQAIPVGTLTYSRQGMRENTSFAYDETWLERDNRFEISPDLPLTRERYFRKAATRSDSIFHFAIADTEPDGWGCKVIARDHAKRRKSGKVGEGSALTEMDYLLGVDDVGRVGALRFQNATGEFMRTPGDGERGIPPLLELTEIVGAAHAVERGTETAKDLDYLPDDHLNNHGFLHVGHGQWRLAPAFDLNPFPDKGRDHKTWLTEDAMHAAAYFHLTDEHAVKILGEVHGAVSQWRQVARNVAVGMTIQELEAFDAAFEHEETQIAKQLLA